MPKTSIDVLERQLSEARMERAARIANLRGLGYAWRVIAELEGLTPEGARQAYHDYQRREAQAASSKAGAP